LNYILFSHGRNLFAHEKKVKTILKLAAKVGEPWISFHSADEMEHVLGEYGFSVTKDKNLGDLNAAYFSPLDRTLDEAQIFKLEQFVVAQNKK